MPADRDLLFGMLALQNGLIDRDRLLAAFREWRGDRRLDLAGHLIARGDLERFAVGWLTGRARGPRWSRGPRPRPEGSQGPSPAWNAGDRALAARLAP